MILSSVFTLFATQVLGSIGRGFRQHGRLVAEYPWPIIVFRFENALKLPFWFFLDPGSITAITYYFQEVSKYHWNYRYLLSLL